MKKCIQMGCFITYPYTVETDQDIIYKLTKQRLYKMDKISSNHATFYTDKKKHLWKIVKNIRKEDMKETYFNNLRVFLLNEFPYILSPTSVVWMDNTSVIGIQMPRAETDLFNILSNPFDVPLVLNGMKGIICAINWLHEQGLAHHDIKPENIVLHQFKFKLIDFDFTMPLEEIHFCGTEHFLCNENIVKKWNTKEIISNNTISKRMDNYSFGKTIYSILWQACVHQYIIKHKRKIWNRFHSEIVNEDHVELAPVWQQWIDLADQCCSMHSLRELPTTMKDTLTTENLPTVMTPTKVVHADPTFA